MIQIYSNSHGPLRIHILKVWNFKTKLYVFNCIKRYIILSKVFKKNQNMFQTCVHNQKVPRKETLLHLLFSLNTMIRNIKIQNIFDINNVSNFI